MLMLLVCHRKVVCCVPVGDDKQVALGDGVLVLDGIYSLVGGDYPADDLIRAEDAIGVFG
jgi:hypothetical protein